MAVRNAKYLGVDLSTTAISVGVRGQDGDEDFVAVSVRGATTWHGQPAHLTEYLPTMFISALWQLEDRGWSFDAPGNVSWSVRQHDMVLMDDELAPLMPAVSWECHVAVKQVEYLKELRVDKVVGPIEPRFILPKLIWALQQEPDLARRVRSVATTGDYMSAQLTGELKLSASDALSNALLNQETKQLAQDAISRTRVSPDWFPAVIRSGSLVGKVARPLRPGAGGWSVVQQVLQGWSVGGGLGDNHAGAVGCGLADAKTIVISGGSSGTVVRACSPTASLAGRAACFEYFDDRLLLMMLADCAIWYNRFINKSGRPADHEAFNQAALEADLAEIVRVTQQVRDGKTVEVYPDNWGRLSWPVQVASTQFSIALELLLLVRAMLEEVKDGDPSIERFVLTGGLCQSPFVRSVLQAGLNLLADRASVKVSGRSDKLAFQTATYGALINAILLGDYAQLPDTIGRLCPQTDCDVSDRERVAALQGCLKRFL